MHRATMAYINAAMDMWEHAFANKCGDKYGIEKSRMAQHFHLAMVNYVDALLAHVCKAQLGSNWGQNAKRRHVILIAQTWVSLTPLSEHVWARVASSLKW